MAEVVWNEYRGGKLAETSTWESDAELRTYLMDDCGFLSFEDIIDRLFVERKVELSDGTTWELI